MDTKDLILRKARFEDWEDLYQNIWSREESARHMLWKVTTSEEEARDRIQRTVEFQRDHEAWIVCEKADGRVIGWAGIRQLEPGVYEDTGVAVGPEYTGRGYGKQIVSALTEYVFETLGGQRLILSCRSANAPSRGTILSCGFTYTHSEDRVDPRDDSPYVVEFYERKKTELV